MAESPYIKLGLAKVLGQNWRLKKWRDQINQMPVKLLESVREKAEIVKNKFLGRRFARFARLAQSQTPRNAMLTAYRLVL